jgi:hypothetical protein
VFDTALDPFEIECGAHATPGTPIKEYLLQETHQAFHGLPFLTEELRSSIALLCTT